MQQKNRPTHLLEDQALHQQEEAIVDPGRTNLGQFSQSEDLEEVDQMKKANLAETLGVPTLKPVTLTNENCSDGLHFGSMSTKHMFSYFLGCTH